MENRIVSILINLDGDIIVTYADGTTQNLGPSDGLDPESILAQCQAAQAAAEEAATAAVAAVESIPADYSQLVSDVEDLKTDVTGIETALASKADAGDLDILAADIADLSDTKADKDGVYDYLTAGLANQLATDKGVTDCVPYLIRPSGGGVSVGSYEEDKIVGGSVVWNQLVDANTQSVTVASGHKVFSVINGSASVSASDGTALAVTGGTDMVCDLTQMFGTTVADYIYGLETATAGAGVAWLKQHFPKQFNAGYQEYNDGEIKSVSGLVSHRMKDADDNVIGNYPLDSELVLRGIPKIVDGKLTYDGDTYSADGTVERKFVVATFDGSSDENWIGSGSGDSAYFCIKIGVLNSVINNRIVCDKYVQTQIAAAATSIGINVVNSSARNQAQISIRPDGIADLTVGTFKALLASDPITVIYELAEPTTEQSTPYQIPQLVDPDGTEEYVLSDGAFPLPVGHETFYPENLKEKIEGLPWDFSAIIAPTESGYTAGRPYASGDLFIVDNILYKAVASIAAGATITPGTNCTETTVAAEIKALQ